MSASKSTETVREAVRDRYAEVAKAGSSCCGDGSPCCGASAADEEDDGVYLARKVGYAESLRLGYTEADMAAAPEGANLGLGCGNPQAIADLKPGEVVLDLGAGGGFDCFLAARAVGPTGRVIGVDMTPEMVARARENAQKAHFDNVEFRLGEIEHLPVADGSVDVIISNCVINLSPDKTAVFRDAFRVLRPGGRLAVSDVVATAELSQEWRDDMRLLSACISGAATTSEVDEMLRAAGFVDIAIHPKEQSREFIQEWEPGRNLEDYVLSASICATKPQQRPGADSAEET